MLFLSKLGIFGYIVDIANWFFVKKRLELLKGEDSIWKYYNPRISRLGVLYMVIMIDKAVPDAYISQALDNRLKLLNESLLVINLSGMLDYEYRIVRTDDQKKQYLVKYIPVMNFVNSLWYLIRSFVFGYILYRLFVYFGLSEVVAKYWDVMITFLDI